LELESSFDLTGQRSAMPPRGGVPRFCQDGGGRLCVTSAGPGPWQKAQRPSFSLKPPKAAKSRHGKARNSAENEDRRQPVLRERTKLGCLRQVLSFETRGFVDPAPRERDGCSADDHSKQPQRGARARRPQRQSRDFQKRYVTSLLEGYGAQRKAAQLWAHRFRTLCRVPRGLCKVL